MNYYADVILPLPLQGTFTYQLSQEQSKLLGIGHRVAVSFGKRKIYTGVIKKIHNEKPEFGELKPIEFSYDKNALVSELQIEFWSWISKYYFTPLGDVLKAAMPSTFLLESDTVIIKKQIDHETLEKLSEEEFLIYDALDFKNLKINEVSEILDKKNTYSVIQKMIQKDLIELNFEINEIYKPKLVRVIYSNRETINKSIDLLKKSPKQKEILMQIISSTKTDAYLRIKDLKRIINFSEASLKGLEKKGFISIRKIKINRNEDNKKYDQKINNLSKVQQVALNEINNQLKQKDVLILHGVTSSGKTEIYMKLIESYINSGQQVLYLLPEISLTTQIIQKLKTNFGDKISVFHSRYSLNERTEVWESIKSNKDSSRLIVGTRSSVFLPFNKLGLVIVDEEHETSYKQQDPSPRYNARDSAIYLSVLNNSKVILGSATPSIESSYNAKNEKYGYVKLKERFGNIEMPDIIPLDMRSEIKNEYSSIFSEKLVQEVHSTLKLDKQVILFRNRRGYSPQWICNSCGNNIMCDK